MSVAKTIYTQIISMDRLAFFDWGAKDFINTGKGLRFKTSGAVKKKCYVVINYNHGTDLYDVEFMRIYKGEPKIDKRVEGVFVDNLIPVIDSWVLKGE